MKEVSVAPPSSPGAGRRGYAQPRPQGFSLKNGWGGKREKPWIFLREKPWGRGWATLHTLVATAVAVSSHNLVYRDVVIGM